RLHALLLRSSGAAPLLLIAHSRSCQRPFAALRAGVSPFRASVPIESERRLQILVLTCFLDASRCPASLENAIGSAHQPEPARADIEREHCGVGDVEALDRSGHVEPREMAAGLARQLPEALALGAQHQRQRRAQGDPAEILGSLTVEA